MKHSSAPPLSSSQKLVAGGDHKSAPPLSGKPLAGTPIRVFVGCAPNHEDAESQAVLEYTLRKHASEPVEITWMKLSRDPSSPFYSDGSQGWQTQRWATPFSGFRWAVPALAGYSGKAVYMDSDMIALADMADLTRQAFMPGRIVMGAPNTWRLCVSLWDCERAARWIPPIADLMADPNQHAKMRRLLESNPSLKQAYAGQWNRLDKDILDETELADPAIKVVHYTDMSAQPQLRHALPRLAVDGRGHWFDGKPQPHKRPHINALFDRLLAEAIDAGYRPDLYCGDPLYGEMNKKSLAGYAGTKARRKVA